MSRGRFGIHGGQFIPETLMSAVTELEEAYEYYKKDPQFKAWTMLGPTARASSSA